MTSQDHATIRAMGEHGGRFVSMLGLAASHADPDNPARLKAAFPEYWAKYAAMAAPVSNQPTPDPVPMPSLDHSPGSQVNLDRNADVSRELK